MTKTANEILTEFSTNRRGSAYIDDLIDNLYAHVHSNNDTDLKDFDVYKDLCYHVDFTSVANYAKVMLTSFFSRGSRYDHTFNESKYKLLGKSDKYLVDVVKDSIIKTSKYAKTLARRRSIELTEVYDSRLGIEYISDLDKIVEFSAIGNKLETTYGSPAIDMRPRLKSCLKMLENEFKKINLQIDKFHNKIFYKDTETGEYKIINDYNEESFISFLELVSLSSTEFERSDTFQPYISDFVKVNLNSTKFSTELIDNDVIQFNDCYLEKGQFKKGNYNAVPRFFIYRDIWKTANTGKIKHHVPEIDELLLHLCNYDDSTVKVFKSKFSSFLMNDAALKANKEATVNVLYGASGRNGKSTFLNLLIRMVGKENTQDMQIRQFESDHRDNLMQAFCQALMVLDEDASETQMQAEVARTMKLYVHGSPITCRRVYAAESVTMRPVGMIVICSNHMLSSADKSNGLTRRLSIFRQDYTISNVYAERNDKWFESLETDKSAQYLLELFVVAHIQNMNRAKLLTHSDEMSDSISRFDDKNDSASMFVKDVGMSQIILKPVKSVRQMYENWCEINSVTPLKNKFSTTLEARYGIVSKVMSASSIACDSSDLLMLGVTGSTVRAWCHKTPEINDKYRARFLDNASNLQKVRISNDRKSTALSIMKALEDDDMMINVSRDELIKCVMVVTDGQDSSMDGFKSYSSELIECVEKHYSYEDVRLSNLDDVDKTRFLNAISNEKALSGKKDPNTIVRIYRSKL